MPNQNTDSKKGFKSYKLNEDSKFKLGDIWMQYTGNIVAITTINIKHRYLQATDYPYHLRARTFQLSLEGITIDPMENEFSLTKKLTKEDNPEYFL